MESADTKWSDEIVTSFVMDAFTAHPELSAIFVHDGPVGAIATHGPWDIVDVLVKQM